MTIGPLKPTLERIRIGHTGLNIQKVGEIFAAAAISRNRETYSQLECNSLSSLPTSNISVKRSFLAV